jgi:hypothetical protein
MMEKKNMSVGPRGIAFVANAALQIKASQSMELTLHCWYIPYGGVPVYGITN